MQYAELPLWNADEVRGKIVAVMRGPPPPHEGTPYAVKILHAQEAGAAGVIIVECDTRCPLHAAN